MPTAPASTGSVPYGRARRLHDHRQGLLGCLGRLVVLLELVDDLLRRRLHLLDHAAPARPSDLRDLVLEVVPVGRNLAAEAGGLEGQGPGESAQDPGRENDHDDHRRRPGQPSLEDADDRTEDEGQKPGYGYRREELAAEVERADRHQHARARSGPTSHPERATSSQTDRGEGSEWSARGGCSPGPARVIPRCRIGMTGAPVCSLQRLVRMPCRAVQRLGAAEIAARHVEVSLGRHHGAKRTTTVVSQCSMAAAPLRTDRGCCGHRDCH